MLCWSFQVSELTNDKIQLCQKTITGRVTVFGSLFNLLMKLSKLLFLSQDCLTLCFEGNAQSLVLCCAHLWPVHSVKNSHAGRHEMWQRIGISQTHLVRRLSRDTKLTGKISGTREQKREVKPKESISTKERWNAACKEDKTNWQQREGGLGYIY